MPYPFDELPEYTPTEVPAATITADTVYRLYGTDTVSITVDDDQGVEHLIRPDSVAFPVALRWIADEIDRIG